MIALSPADALPATALEHTRMGMSIDEEETAAEARLQAGEDIARARIKKPKMPKRDRYERVYDGSDY